MTCPDIAKFFDYDVRRIIYHKVQELGKKGKLDQWCVATKLLRGKNLNCGIKMGTIIKSGVPKGNWYL